MIETTESRARPIRDVPMSNPDVTATILTRGRGAFVVFLGLSRQMPRYRVHLAKLASIQILSNLPFASRSYTASGTDSVVKCTTKADSTDWSVLPLSIGLAVAVTARHSQNSRYMAYVDDRFILTVESFYLLLNINYYYLINENWIIIILATCLWYDGPPSYLFPVPRKHRKDQ